RLTNTRDSRLWVITAVVGIVTAVTGTEVAVLFLAAGFAMVLIDAPPEFLRRSHPPLMFAAPFAVSLGGWTASGGTQVALGLFFPVGGSCGIEVARRCRRS